MIRRWLSRRRERPYHNDRDYWCKYWWGDRRGYDLNTQRCTICRPKEAA